MTDSLQGGWVGFCKIETIGHRRYYETMAFHSDENDTMYHDIDVTKGIDLDCKCDIDHFEEDSDNEANDMHENAVRWVCDQLKEGVKL